MILKLRNHGRQGLYDKHIQVARPTQRTVKAANNAAQFCALVPSEEITDCGNPETATRPVREYLGALEEANPSYSPPNSMSLRDPSSTWTEVHGPAYFAYCTNCLIDLDAGIIMDVELPLSIERQRRTAPRLWLIEPKRNTTLNQFGL